MSGTGFTRTSNSITVLWYKNVGLQATPNSLEFFSYKHQFLINLSQHPFFLLSNRSCLQYVDDHPLDHVHHQRCGCYPDQPSPRLVPPLPLMPDTLVPAPGDDLPRGVIERDQVELLRLRYKFHRVFHHACPSFLTSLPLPDALFLHQALARLCIDSAIPVE